MQSGLALTGFIHVRLWDENGNLKAERKIHNLVVDRGREHIAARLSQALGPLGGPVEGPMTHMAIEKDTGGTAAPAVVTAGDTAPANEVHRNALETNYPLYSGSQVQYRGVFAPGEGTSTPGDLTTYINAAAILNAGAAGVMLARGGFVPVVKEVGDSLTVDWAVNLNAP